MPARSPILVNNEVYHVLNRAVGDENILVSKKDLERVLDLWDYYRFPQKLRFSKFRDLPSEIKENYLAEVKNQSPLVIIFSFSLMPNHYHLLLKQLQDGGIEKFISNFQNSFAKYFNLKNKRHGTLFQNSFKAKRVENEDQFVHISRYIHLNPVTSFLIEFKDLAFYPWTSFSWYLNENKNRFVETDSLLKIFKTKENYKQFVEDQTDYQRELGLIKKLLDE